MKNIFLWNFLCERKEFLKETYFSHIVAVCVLLQVKRFYFQSENYVSMCLNNTYRKELAVKILFNWYNLREKTLITYIVF